MFRAYDAYTAEFEAGDDGAADWVARKACNYMTAAVEDCSNTLQPPCYSPDLATRMKEAQFDHALAGLQDTVEEWNSELCPAMRCRASEPHSFR